MKGGSLVVRELSVTFPKTIEESTPRASNGLRRGPLLDTGKAYHYLHESFKAAACKITQHFLRGLVANLPVGNLICGVAQISLALK